MESPAPGTPEFVEWARATMAAADLEGLPQDDVAALSPFAKPRACPQGAVLFRAEEAPHSTFIVADGEVELVYETPFERLVLQILGPGSTLGYLAVVLDHPYAYSAIVRRPTRLLQFDRATINSLIESEPQVCFRWLRLVAANLERSQRRLVELAGKTAFERVAHFLINRTAERDSAALDLTQRDIAQALALSRQTVSRVLSEMREQGLVEHRRGEVRVSDLARLRQHTPPAAHS